MLSSISSNLPARLRTAATAAWLPYALIVLVAFLAHPWVLQAEFFMDDGGHILSSPSVIDGQWQAAEWRWLPYLIWSSLFSLIQAIHPSNQSLDLESYAPLFHALNFSVHLAIACLVFFCGKDIFERSGFLVDSKQRRMAALLGALVFACHPIGSEAVHYARCLMIDCVTLFSVLTAWAVFRFVKQPSALWALVATAAIGGAAISKHPGIVHAVTNLFVVCCATVSFLQIRKLRHQEIGQDLRPHLIVCGSILMVMVVAFAFFWKTHFGFRVPVNFEIHALTQGRLFWAYFARILMPVNLAVDHWVPWSVSFRDLSAVFALIATFCVFAASAWLTMFTRHRVIGMLLALALAPLAMRFGYVIRELMVEYRVYPALPWIGLLIGIGLTWIWSKKQVYGIAATAVVLVSFVTLSQHRSYLWSDADKLLANTLQSYPSNVRAQSLLQLEAFRREDWNAVLEQMINVEKAVRDTFKENSENPHRQYETNRLGQHWSEAHQYVTFAIAKRDGNEAAINYADAAIQRMNKVYPGAFINLETGDYVKDNPLVMARQALVKIAAR